LDIFENKSYRNTLSAADWCHDSRKLKLLETFKVLLVQVFLLAQILQVSVSAVFILLLKPLEEFFGQ